MRAGGTPTGRRWDFQGIPEGHPERGGLLGGEGGGEEMENGYEIAGWTMVREWRRGVEGRAAGRA